MFEEAIKCMYSFSKTKCIFKYKYIFKYKCMHVNAWGYIGLQDYR